MMSRLREKCSHTSRKKKHTTLKRVTYNPLSWNKAGDFRTPILCPNMDKNKIEAAHGGKNARATLHLNKDILKSKNPSSEQELNASRS